MTTSKLYRAAKAALAADGKLTASQAAGDAFENDADDLPVDSAGWLAWYDTHKPVYAAWQAAMGALDAAGYDKRRHPFVFRPFCEAVIREHVAASRAAGGGRRR